MAGNQDMSGFFGKMLGQLGSGGGQAQVPNAGNLLADVMSSSGGVQGLLGQFEQAGFGDHVRSWIGNGENWPISPQEIEQVIPPQQLDQFAQAHGLPAGAVSSVLAQLLPHAVNAATPDGSAQVADQSGSAQSVNFAGLAERFLGGGQSGT